MSADEWWARQQALRAKFLSTVRLLLDEEPALRGEDNKVRHSVEEFHRVLSQQHALSGEVPRCDMDKLLKYETTFDGLLTALRRTRELASAPPPAHAAPSPHPADAVQTPLEPVASPAPARAVEEEAEGADGADGADGAEGMEGVEGAEDWRAIHSAVRDVMYANGDAAAPLPACVRLLLDSLGRWQALLVAAARVERDGRASLCGKRLRQLHPGEHEAHRKMRPVQNTVSNTEASAIWRSGGGLHREPGRASGCPRLRPASANQPLGRALAPRPSRSRSRHRRDTGAVPQPTDAALPVNVCERGAEVGVCARGVLDRHGTPHDRLVGNLHEGRDDDGGHPRCDRHRVATPEQGVLAHVAAIEDGGARPRHAEECRGHALIRRAEEYPRRGE